MAVKDLTVRIGGHLVLEDVNLEVFEGDFLGLIGPNGGGKSTLLKAILGLVRPTKGVIRIFGRPLSETRNLIGYLPQKSLFDQKFPVTALEVVLMGRFGRVGLFRRYNDTDYEVARNALKSVNMLDLADRNIGSLSGGQQQRVFVARAIASEPKLILLDEPTSGIDSSQQAEFYELLSRLNQKMAIILVSHDLSAVSRYVNKIACLNKHLYYHSSKELSEDDLKNAYGCPIDLIAHGVPHRVLQVHD